MALVAAVDVIYPNSIIHSLSVSNARAIYFFNLIFLNAVIYLCARPNVYLHKSLSKYFLTAKLSCKCLQTSGVFLKYGTLWEFSVGG